MSDLKKKHEDILEKITNKEWSAAILIADELITLFPDDTLMFILKKSLTNIKEQQYDLAKSLLENILEQEEHNELACKTYRVCKEMIVSNASSNALDKMTMTSPVEDVKIFSGKMLPLSDETINNASTSGEMTVSETSQNIDGVSPGADTKKISKNDIDPEGTISESEALGTISELEGTVVDSTSAGAAGENFPLEESNAPTMVMGTEREISERSMFIDASTISKARKIGPYHDLIEIGRGGMGVVYKAYDTENNRYIALKTIREEDVPEEIKKRFVREMDIVSKLDHPNIIRIFDKFFYNDRMFFSMEFIDGKTIKELQEGNRPFPLEEIMEIMLKICDALEHAHEKGIIHRDLKPSNIMLDINNHVKVVDFGIAKKMDEEKYTRTGQVVGSIQYMPPEQMNGNVHDIDERSDIYTMGAILYEMIMKVPPFPSPKIKNEMPKKLKSICLKCLHETKESRYQSVSLLKKELQAFTDTFKETKAQKTYALMQRIAIIVIISALAGYSFYLNNSKENLNRNISQKDAEIEHLKKQLLEKKLTQTHLEADLLFRNFNYNEAIKKYSSVISLNAGLKSAHIMRGRSYLAIKKYDEAIKDFSVVEKQRKQTPEAYYFRGSAYHQLGNYEKAIPDYEQALLFEEDHKDALWGLAQIYYEKQYWDKSEAYLLEIINADKVRKITRNKGLIYQLLASIYEKKQESYKAIKNILFAYFADPYIQWSKKQEKLLNFSLNNEPYLMRSLQLFADRYPENIREFFQNYTQHNSFFSTAIGVLYENKKKYNDAKKWYLKAIKQKESSGAYRLSRLYFKGLGVEKNPEKASLILQNAIKNNAPNGVLFFYLGHSYLKGRGVYKSIEKAISLYEKGANLQNYDCMYFLGVKDYKQRNFEESFDWINKAKKSHSSNALIYLAEKFYKKGYYVNRNNEKAKELIAKAKKIEEYYK